MVRWSRLSTWTKRRAAARVLAILALVCGLGGVAAFGGPHERAAAQDEAIPAALVELDGGEIGGVAAELRDLTPGEGGAWTSFTTVDREIADLTGGGYGLVVGDPDAPSAFGEIAGEGEDIYVAVFARDDSGLGGVAWLHARGARTQISLFVGEGLGGDGGSDQDGEENEDGPPEPPAEETPELEPTGEPSGETATYVSPSYGYSLTYDVELWNVGTEETYPESAGPLDYLALRNDRGNVQVELIGLGPLDPPLPADEYIGNFADGLLNDQTLSDVAIRLDDDGEEIRGGDADHAWVAVDFTFVGQSGNDVPNTYHIYAWNAPAPNAFIVIIFQTPQREYDLWEDDREALVEGLEFVE